MAALDGKLDRLVVDYKRTSPPAPSTRTLSLSERVADWQKKKGWA